MDIAWKCVGGRKVFLTVRGRQEGKKAKDYQRVKVML